MDPLTLAIIGGAVLLAAHASGKGSTQDGSGPSAGVSPPTGPDTSKEKDEKPPGFQILATVAGLGAGAAATAGALAAEAALIKVTDLVDQAVGATDGQRAANVIAPVTTLGVLGQKAGEAIAGALGASGDVKKQIGITTGLFLVAPPLAGTKILLEGGSAALGAIAGKQAEQDVRKLVSEFDPTKSDSLVGGAVSAAGSLIGGLIGIKLGPPGHSPSSVGQVADEASKAAADIAKGVGNTVGSGAKAVANAASSVANAVGSVFSGAGKLLPPPPPFPPVPPVVQQAAHIVSNAVSTVEHAAADAANAVGNAAKSVAGIFGIHF